MLDEVGVCAIMLAHSLDDFAGNTHPHMFKVAIIAHYILQHLIPRSPCSGPHSLRRYSIRQSARRDNFQPVTIDRQFNIGARKQIIAVN